MQDTGFALARRAAIADSASTQQAAPQTHEAGGSGGSISYNHGIQQVETPPLRCVDATRTETPFRMQLLLFYTDAV